MQGRADDRAGCHEHRKGVACLTLNTPVINHLKCD
jgi:hypothetical protein